MPQVIRVTVRKVKENQRPANEGPYGGVNDFHPRRLIFSEIHTVQKPCNALQTQGVAGRYSVLVVGVLLAPFCFYFTPGRDISVMLLQGLGKCMPARAIRHKEHKRCFQRLGSGF